MATKSFARVFTPKTRNGAGDSFARCTKCKDRFDLSWESRRGTHEEAMAAATEHDAENHSN